MVVLNAVLRLLPLQIAQFLNQRLEWRMHFQSQKGPNQSRASSGETFREKRHLEVSGQTLVCFARGL